MSKEKFDKLFANEYKVSDPDVSSIYKITTTDGGSVLICTSLDGIGIQFFDKDKNKINSTTLNQAEAIRFSDRLLSATNHRTRIMMEAIEKETP